MKKYLIQFFTKFKVKKYHNDYIFQEINDKLQTKIQRNSIQYILDFTLLWNLFKLHYFNNFFKVYDKNRKIDCIAEFIDIYGHISDAKINIFLTT